MSRKSPKIKFNAWSVRPMRCAAINTSHITRDDGKLLEDVWTAGVEFAYLGGAVVCIQQVLDSIACPFSDEFYVICKEAKRAGYRYLRFDGDAPRYDNFPTYEW